MKLVFAPDSFKESLSAAAVARILDRAARRHFSPLETLLTPIADGGEGTAEAMTTALGGKLYDARVPDPLGREITARFGMLPDNTAVIELAEASGLHLVAPTDRNVLRANTYGTGQLIAHALSIGAKKLYIGLGGSATNDGGMGMLSALGARFFSASGEELPPSGGALKDIAHADLSGLSPRFLACDIDVICDVTNPLLGERGATSVYGPQKGADGAALVALEAGMRTFSGVMRTLTGIDASIIPGAGAAGGVGAALYFTARPRMLRGIDAVLDAVHFESALNGASLVITGEGRFDGQSVLYGKAPVGVARRAFSAGVPVIVFAGAVMDGADQLFELGPASIVPITPGPMTLDEAIARAEELTFQAADRLFRTLKIGMTL